MSDYVIKLNTGSVNRNSIMFEPNDQILKFESSGPRGLKGDKGDAGNAPAIPRVTTITSSATPSINIDTHDVLGITALAEDITSITVSGSPSDGQKLLIYIIGTATRAISLGASFEASTVALPTTTVNTNRLDMGFIYNSGGVNKWRCIGTS